MSKTTYFWEEETGIATCTIHYHDKKFIGVAQCHPDDEDFKSELVGSELAYLRASVRVMQEIKNEKWIELKALKGLYGSLTPSPKFKVDSFEAKMLRQRIDTTREDIDILKDVIGDLKNRIHAQIEDSENFYQGVRKNRRQREEALKNE